MQEVALQKNDQVKICTLKLISAVYIKKEPAMASSFYPKVLG
jgi:hypothetical protein